MSLFDGMACGMIAFKQLGINIDEYHAYEIDKYAIKISSHNFPEIIHHGDVFKGNFVSYKGFDYLRIGPDVSLKFDDVWFMRGLHRERISTKITLQNTIYRSFLNDRLFGNDPDVFLLRDNNISLSNKQKEALITINALFGNVLMTSDNIADYDEEKKKLLSNAFDIYYHSKVLGFERRNDEILIKYELNGKVNNIIYNTKKGVLING